MACSLKTIFYVSGSDKTVIGSRAKGVSGLCPSIRSLQFAQSRSRYIGKSITLLDQKGLREWTTKATARTFAVHAQASKGMTGAVRWWENRKILKPNMTEVHSAQVLVESLLNAGDKLIIVEFYSPGCGGCQALHPKICELAESNPNATFLRVNCEQLRTMCCSLHIPVVPFFRFYRGAEGRLCSFSCTNATIKKFKDALAKHGTEKCNMGPAKGLDESELLSLASVGEITIESKSPSSPTRDAGMEDLVLEGTRMYSKASNELKLREGSAILMA